ncbi:unnamed protein product [Vitrella brassicaformis CCMP3155]|uniref:GH16 domain-containing protein n=1 Tax=Vitrella brassicaformis (strain CCMP3155) TaxID=1169540 RepID=A0A0G4GNC2_VITBC|nr:unnamed protein product [Vitrella brassicaformis CCMP3155]|mmetsp:Transcript_833/g.1843  ORF Transcript_833/g.1843 Transcript_833/m.1843 type:complete len:350 (-) Transcript_833:227-1276(-)|eukprot:CEM31690.1 unnamed protein product [Vitrella brassicaformis CCMP3155]
MKRLELQASVWALFALKNVAQQSAVVPVDGPRERRSSDCDPFIDAARLQTDDVRCLCPGLGGSCYGHCGRNFDAAEVASVEPFRYGRFETRLFPNTRANGTVVTFFLYKNESDKIRGASWKEIDFEVHGMGNHSEEPIQTNIITGTMEDRSSSEMFFPAPGRSRDVETQTKAVKTGFHHFAIEWTPDHVAWFFDGQRIRHEVSCEAQGVTGALCSPQVAQLNEAMNLRMSVWPLNPLLPWAEHWAGIFDAKHTRLPLTVYYDYVKVYDYDPLSEGFILRWTDAFRSFNTSRWETSMHTFLANEAHFRPDKAAIAPTHAMDACDYLALSIARTGTNITVSTPSGKCRIQG